MKNILFTLALLISFSSFSQLKLNEIIKVSKMDRESFEMYSLNNNFQFYEIDENEDFNSFTMVKGGVGNTEYLTHYFYSSKRRARYQFSIGKLQNIYKELKAIGFKLVNSRNSEFGYEKTYERSNKEEIEILINSQNPKFVIDYSKEI